MIDGRPIIKRSDVLADGRQLVYYDDADTMLPAERLPDRRSLVARSPTAVMRQDPLTDEWVSVAAARSDRIFLPPDDLDPLAPATPDNPSEVPSRYDVAVFENRSPAFGPDLLPLEDLPSPAGNDIVLGRSRPAVGRCEVVCFSPESQGSFALLPKSRVRTIIEAWADRTSVLSALPGVEQVFPFENRGEQIGVTLHHPHGQIYAYPFVTPRTARLIASVGSYGPELFADILRQERAGERVVLSGDHWSAFVPFAARWPLEIHVLPHRHIPDLAATNGEERDELADFYPRLLRALDALYDSPTPYISAWHQAPVHSHRDRLRLMAQITSPRRAVDRWKYLAGSESAMGAFIGDIPPERAAERLRRAMS